jgi:hypothetical protein
MNAGGEFGAGTMLSLEREVRRLGQDFKNN